jgi:hypothetical protein
MLPGASRVRIRASAAEGKPSTFTVAPAEGTPVPESDDDAEVTQLNAEGVKVGNTCGIALVHPSAHLMRGNFRLCAVAFYKACSLLLFFVGASRGVSFSDIPSHIKDVAEVLKYMYLLDNFGMTKKDLADANHPAGHIYCP